MNRIAVRKQFPILQKGIYANTAVLGPLYQNLYEWRQNYLNQYQNDASWVSDQNSKIIVETRSSIAQFFSTGEENVALVPNFTTGLNMLLDGLSTNERVLLLEEDYPSLNWSFENRSFQRSYVAINARLEEHIYQTIKSNEISILAISLVQWLNGFMIDMDFLKQLKKEFPDLLIIADGTQYCGMYKLNFQQSGIDVLGASGYKWLLSGYGNGFFMIQDTAMPRFSLRSIGYGSGRNLRNGTEVLPLCRQLEVGHLDGFSFGSLNFSLRYLNSMGMEGIHLQNKALSQRAQQIFGEGGFLEEAVRTRKQHSTIFNIKGDDGIYEKLTRNQVVCAQRGSGIRLSFHFYNVVDEIVKILDILKS